MSRNQNVNRYKGGFEVRSESSGKVYKISFDTYQQAWVCSCMGCIHHGHCKHLEQHDLVGRRGY